MILLPVDSGLSSYLVYATSGLKRGPLEAFDAGQDARETTTRLLR